MSQGTCEEAREPLKGNLKEIADKFVEATEAVSIAGVKLRSEGIEASIVRGRASCTRFFKDTEIGTSRR
jgi:hypothetical protein